MSFAGQPWPRRGVAPTLLGFVLLVLSASVGVAAEMRIALVIGNGTYREAPLKNPPEDARLIADTLKRLGFTVIGAKPLIDADQKTMKRAMRNFGEQLERVGSGGVGLFFYAGHAVQSNGKNYLIPVGADIRGEADLEDNAVSADSVLVQMTYAGARVNLVVLDACRNNPYRGRFRSPTRGLAEMSTPYGSLVAYSTAPGDVAEDGTGKNSPYSAALAEAMGIADMPVELAFKRVRSVVMQATGNRQVPWESSSLTGDFFFKPATSVAQPAPPPGIGGGTMSAGALGAAGGGLLGAAAGGGAPDIAAGVLLGGLLGGATGSYLDDQDKRTTANTTHQALESKPSGTTTTWTNPHTGHSGSVTPLRTYQASNGQYCREFEQSVTIGGKPQKSYGTACRQPDGSWQIVS